MCDDTPRCVTLAAHARWVEEARQAVVRVAGLDPDGPLEPMRPAAVWQREGERRPERVYREARDAALIAAIGKLWR